MSDLISRQAAIDAIRESTSKYTGFMEMEMYTDDDAVEAINGVPSIDAVPVKRGVWVTYTDGSMHCSNCSKIPVNRIYALSRLVYDVDIGSMMKYCPNCGARMDGEE